MKTFLKIFAVLAVVGVLLLTVGSIVVRRNFVQMAAPSKESLMVRQLCLAIITHAQKHDEFPQTIPIERVFNVAETEEFLAKTNFRYNPPSKSLEDLKGEEGEMPLLVCYHSEGAWVGFLDTHVTWYRYEELRSDETMRQWFLSAREPAAQ